MSLSWAVKHYRGNTRLLMCICNNLLHILQMSLSPSWSGCRPPTSCRWAASICYGGTTGTCRRATGCCRAHWRPSGRRSSAPPASSLALASAATTTPTTRCLERGGSQCMDHLFILFLCLFCVCACVLCVGVCVWVYVSVYERERKKDMCTVCVGVYVWVCLCICVVLPSFLFVCVSLYLCVHRFTWHAWSFPTPFRMLTSDRMAAFNLSM